MCINGLDRRYSMHDVGNRCVYPSTKQGETSLNPIIPRSRDRKGRNGITSFNPQLPAPIEIEHTHLINLPLQIHHPIFLHPRNTTSMGFLTIPYPLLQWYYRQGFYGFPWTRLRRGWGLDVCCYLMCIKELVGFGIGIE